MCSFFFIYMIDLISYLKQFVFDRRFEQIEKKLNDRTKYITIVLENLFQSHNASAVLRTCDCLGIQDVYAVETANSFKVCDAIALGSSKWLDLYTYNSTSGGISGAIQSLRKSGYRIVATSPHHNDVELNNFDLQKGKVALIFGTELEGLSEPALNQCDEFVKIPIYGFTESYNVSVSAGIILYSLINQLRASSIQWHLTDDQKQQLLLRWLKASIKDSDLIVDRYQKMISAK